jgi:hypothetical protein
LTPRAAERAASTVGNEGMVGKSSQQRCCLTLVDRHALKPELLRPAP